MLYHKRIHNMIALDIRQSQPITARYFMYHQLENWTWKYFARMDIETEICIFLLGLIIMGLASFPCMALHINAEPVLKALGQDPTVARYVY